VGAPFLGQVFGAIFGPGNVLLQAEIFWQWCRFEIRKAWPLPILWLNLDETSMRYVSKPPTGLIRNRKAGDAVPFMPIEKSKTRGAVTLAPVICSCPAV